MDVGLALFWQNYLGSRSDQDLYKEELGLADLAEPLGFDSLWTVEHHFTDYCICPDPLQFLTYMAGRTNKVKLGSQVVVLPWHDPIRVAENVAVLDNYCNGRTVLGIGRGLGRVEFEGFGISMEEARGRFLESAQILMTALRTGTIASEGTHFRIPSRQLRPSAPYSFKDRIYSAGASPDTLGSIGELGLRLFVVPARGPEAVGKELALYRDAFVTYQHREPDPTACAIWVFCDDDEGRARELGEEHLANYYALTLSHYDLTGSHFADTKGYEAYARTSAVINTMGENAATKAFASLQAIGTPDQVYEKIVEVQKQLKFDVMTGVFNYGGMKNGVAESSMRLFASSVLPRLQDLELPKAAQWK